MKIMFGAWIALACSLVGVRGSAQAQELKVHLVQANNDSPYAFIRAKFRPGELQDPWAVRFFDGQGVEVSYFVWDSITWREAREGRAEWGGRYALLNHGPGDSPEAAEARSQKLQGAGKNLRELGEKLEAQERNAAQAPQSVCAAMYLVRTHVGALGKERITLRIYPGRQLEPKRRSARAGERISIRQGALEFRDLPDRLGVWFRDREILRASGFDAGGWSDASGHADPSRPYWVEALEGIVTQVTIASQTRGRREGSMSWRSTYWLFPEGSWVGLEGFSPSDTEGYVGGPQKLGIWKASGNLAARHAPDWDSPWWLHEAGGEFVATHLFYATPLAIGFGNNPFAVNAEGAGKEPAVKADGDRLELVWSHRIDDPAIMRVMAPQPLRRPNDPPPAAEPLVWRPKVDWLYRQYAAGVGDMAEGALRAVLGAAAGWIDRPVTEEEVAARLVDMMPGIATRPETAEIGLLKIVPAVLKNDSAAIQETFRKARDQAARTDYYIDLMRRHVERGGRASEGKKKNDPDGTPREGWTGNPCYHAALMPCYVRVLEHFELPFPEDRYRKAILRYADFTLDLLGGAGEKLNATFESEWPSRIVPILPLMMHAYTLKPDDKYAQAAKMLFGDLGRLVRRNPHGYFPAWTFNPKADKYDTVYNPVSYERGITSLWSEGLVDLVGREEASRFVAAQARWLVFSGQLVDTLEMDNATAIRASTHGAHTNLRNQIGIYLYDDFEFYRGLVSDLVDWSAASAQVSGKPELAGMGPYRSLELSNAGSSMLRWALGIRPGSKWLESKVERTGKDGFRLAVWNRLPKAQPTVKVEASQAGLKAQGDLLHVQLHGPAFRVPAQFEVTWTADRMSVQATRPAKIRLYFGALAKGRWEFRVSPSGVIREKDYIEWQAAPGEYVLVK